LWILSLPDDSGGIVGWQPKTTNVIAKAKALIVANSKNGNTENISTCININRDKNDDNSSGSEHNSALPIDTGNDDAAGKKEGNDKYKNEDDKGNSNVDNDGIKITKEKGKEKDEDKKNRQWCPKYPTITKRYEKNTVELEHFIDHSFRTC